MKIKLVVQNPSDKDRRVNLFNALSYPLAYSDFKDEIITVIYSDNLEKNEIPYSFFLKRIMIEPILATIEKTTDNKQLEFYSLDHLGWLNPILTQKKDKNGIWIGGVNMADTQEELVLDKDLVIKLKLNPKQIFEIEFMVIKVCNISKFLQVQ